MLQLVTAVGQERIDVAGHKGIAVSLWCQDCDPQPRRPLPLDELHKCRAVKDFSVVVAGVGGRSLGGGRGGGGGGQGEVLVDGVLVVVVSDRNKDLFFVSFRLISFHF